MDSALQQNVDLRRLWQAAEDNAYSEAERFPKPKVAVEVDGFPLHSNSEDFHQDRKRQNAIALAGWHVLRFTWLDLVEYPQRVIAGISLAFSA